MQTCLASCAPSLTDGLVPRSLANELTPLVKLLAEDRRYKLEAYQFLSAGLEYAQEVMGLGQPGAAPGSDDEDEPPRPVRHVTGQDLCVALKCLAHEQYGFMAKLVLANWGIHSTSDFGEIVFNLIKIGKMSTSADDRREHFDDVYDFERALVKDFVIKKESEPCRH